MSYSGVRLCVKGVTELTLDHSVRLASRGGIKDGDIIVKLNGMPLLTTSDLKEALTEETALLLEVRRGNDDLLFNIQPDVIMH